MNTPILLDTFSMIRVLNDDEIDPKARRSLIEQELETRGHVYASPISAWEMGHWQNRNELITAGLLMEKLSGVSALLWAQMSADLFYAASVLPASPPDDICARIIIATAREQDMTIITNNSEILDYGRTGHVRCQPLLNEKGEREIMTDLKQEFEKAMFNIYKQCEKFNYRPTIFLNMLHEKGAVETARALIISKHPSEGYSRLYEEGRLDLSVEALLVENEKFHSTELFPDIDELLQAARNRLRQYEYQPQ